MLNRSYILIMLQRQRPSISAERADELINEALRLLGNLVHYKSNGKHEDEDVATAALALEKASQ